MRVAPRKVRENSAEERVKCAVLRASVAAGVARGVASAAC